MLRRHCFVGLITGLVLAQTVLCSAVDDPVNFSREILPLLSDRCFHCHGPDEAVREADLRLDLRESATTDNGSGAALVPGKVDASELFARIISEDEDEQMPPPDSGRKKLTPREIELIKKWIQQGAAWGKHWSFEKPIRPKLPDPKLHAIDAFVQQKLRKAGLSMSPAADKRTLIRRLSLDLTGLPPTSSDVQAFLADPSEDAYEKVVDRLLASPHYGERMAWPWLDAARYADSSGYQGDPERTMWPWRDWVIRALNDNMRFDQFTIEQLAGDLLPDSTAEQRLATGFNRNHMHNSEGGRIAEETRVENVFDRAETTGTVWLGMTLNCARCHDHKFDPTSNEDYFRFFDFFNQTSENGRTDRSVAVPPAMSYILPNTREQLASMDQKIASLRQKLMAPKPAADQRQKQWEEQNARNKDDGWLKMVPISAKSLQGATIQKREDHLLHVTGKRPEKDVYELELTTSLRKLTAIRLDALIDPASPAKGTGRDEKGNFVLSEIEAEVVPIVRGQVAIKKVKFKTASADFSQGNYTPDKAIDGKIAGDNGWAVSGHTIKKPRWALFELAKPLTSKTGFKLKIRLRFESQHSHHTLALFRLSASSIPDVVSKYNGLDSELKKIVLKEANKRTDAEKQKLKIFFRRNHSSFFQELSKELAEWESKRNQAASQFKPVKVMVMDSLKKPRDTVILVKGIYNSRTDRKVVAGVPGMLPELKAETDRRLNRLDLAKWIVSPENPLTARVTVNRFWQTLFGRGLVETPNDFGLQGKQPSHPQLLDWLAVEFVESGWNVKHIQKLMVMSETYRQSSNVTNRLLEVDPENRLLGRSSRYRLPSWMIRDQALAASGLLQTTVGGPPVKPYQPQGVWAEATFGKKKYALDSGDKLYRRSIYTFWRRIIGPTMFFDSAKRQTCEVKPNRTNTPLHALTVLNDTTYVEAARVLAEKIMQSEKDFEGRIKMAFLRLCSRLPEPAETKLLTKSFASIVKEFESKPDEATKLLSVGQMPADKSLNQAEHAAWTTLVNMLLNLDEVLVRP